MFTINHQHNHCKLLQISVTVSGALPEGRANTLTNWPVPATYYRICITLLTPWLSN